MTGASRCTRLLARPRIRRFWLIVAMFELLLPSLASVADARAEAASIRTVATHVESPGGTHCPRVHPVDCAVCRVLRTHAAASTPAATLELPPPVGGARLAAAPRPGHSARAPGEPPQRAPPRDG
jgi:hypothetical protein